GSVAIAKLFGLSLVRDFVKNCPQDEHRESRLQIRQALLEWTYNALQSTALEPYIMNNVANILTLSIKSDFPDQWPAAFDEVLSFAEISRNGINLSARIVADLDVEVVMFSEGRTQQEVTQNSRIKDAMREGCIIENIVSFLCSSVLCGTPERDDVSTLCLTTLAEMIGWIDINLIVNDEVLPRLYDFCRDQFLCSPSCDCLLEIAKKGMDSVDKVKLISSIRIVETLSSLPFDSAETSEDREESIGMVADALVVELLSCWISFESYAVEAGAAITATEQKGLLDIGRMTGELLQGALPLLMKVFAHEDSAVASCATPSLKKLIGHMKKQQSYDENPKQKDVSLEPKISQCIATLHEMFSDWFFIAVDMVPAVLWGIYRQLQFPAGFYELSADADEEDVEVAEEIETKNQVRQLFVQCARIRPMSCLELIAEVLTSLPQPLYTAPFPELEAALRLVYSLGECGPQYNAILHEGMFPGIVEALHQSEIQRHRNPLVLTAYYDVSARYAAMSSMDTVQHVMQAMVGAQGIRHPDHQ
ncbi:xpot, partial [Symbiodinium microadriaticum]